ncbi:MAG: diiron oxygenase [Deltaproteobacteria bacterium]|nr:diiron oxygenase [Deltaproteobacteria bacterium]
MDAAPLALTPKTPREGYHHLLARLSSHSVTQRFDAYADLAWDLPEHRVDPEDPRFELGPEEPLSHTRWYQDLPSALRARVGLHLLASYMRVGVQFESVLSQGLLRFAEALPAGSPEFRYALHEVLEEGQHSLMFQEFVGRTGLDPQGMHPLERYGSRRVPDLGRTFPELFFLHVLAGEAPIDYVQRRALRGERPLHPLVAAIMRRHITEEARHLCFAKRFLEERSPRLGALRRAQLQALAPVVLRSTAAAMLRVPGDLVARYQVPPEALREAHRGPLARQRVREGLAPVYALCQRVGLAPPALGFLWRAVGITGAAPSATLSAHLP